MTNPVIFRAGAIFDGERLHANAAARFGPGGLEQIAAIEDINHDGTVFDLGDDILSPGFVDLQVNGGGGVMLNDAPSVGTISGIAEAHWKLGTRRLLPTLITDTAEKTSAAIDAAIRAVADGVPGVAGLHLEGPHLSLKRKGAHDATYIRPMQASDVALLCDAAHALPALMITIAPENTTIEQVTELAEAGALVSLGHTDASFETCLAYQRAGAKCATHLFNAMSQMGNREPGLAGAAIACSGLSAGVIADGIHVHREMLRIAWASKRGPGMLFLVSDAMAVAGTDQSSFELDGREILRANGRLTLEDGTLAGADLDLLTAVRILKQEVGLSIADALRAATTSPHNLISDRHFQPLGMAMSDFIRISSDLSDLSPLDPSAANKRADQMQHSF